MTYRIVSELHVSPAVHYAGRDLPPREFKYAIRRADGSLVFRTQKHKYATEILANLNHPTQEVRAA